jgi:hypothetical protein
MNNLLIALDPTAENGEAALDVIDEEVTGRLTLVVPLYGPAADALDQFAASEEVSVAAAADIYLEQVAAPLRARGLEVATMSIDGSDPVADLLDVVESAGITSVIVPASAANLDGRALSRLIRATQVPLTIVPEMAA